MWATVPRDPMLELLWKTHPGQLVMVCWQGHQEPELSLWVGTANNFRFGGPNCQGTKWNRFLSDPKGSTAHSTPTARAP